VTLCRVCTSEFNRVRFTEKPITNSEARTARDERYNNIPNVNQILSSRTELGALSASDFANTDSGPYKSLSR